MPNGIVCDAPAAAGTAAGRRAKRGGRLVVRAGGPAV